VAGSEDGYEFVGPDGKVSLIDLFDGRRRIVERFITRVSWRVGSMCLTSSATPVS
jgi:predicted dithiol-disulfide oxidoreductase (DUF899 family)